MLCTRCSEREAQVNLTRLVDGASTSAHLCASCYAVETGSPAADVERELRAGDAELHAIAARTRGFMVRPARIRLRVGETRELVDVAVYARTGWLRRERVGCTFDLRTLDPALVEVRGGLCTLVAQACGRTSLAVRPDRPDQFGNCPALAVQIEIAP